MTGKVGMKRDGWAEPITLHAQACITLALRYAAATPPKAALVHEYNIYLLLEWWKYQTPEQQQRALRSINNLLAQIPMNDADAHERIRQYLWAQTYPLHHEEPNHVTT